MTYSIVARDTRTGEMGGCVQSHFFNTGATVLWSEAGTGIVATQSVVEPAYGRMGLDLLRRGDAPGMVLSKLLRLDPAPQMRQVGVLGTHGCPVGHTGGGCIAAAGHTATDSAIALGNMLTREGTSERMIRAFEEARGTLAARLLVAMEAAEQFGGDIRGMQSAALSVVSDRIEALWCEEGALSNSPCIDLRVDDARDPLAELKRLLRLDDFYKRLLALIATPGLIVGPYEVDSAEHEAAIDTLLKGQRLLGRNPEATFWLAILLARGGAMKEARTHFSDALGLRPQLGELARRLIPPGALSKDQFQALIAE